MGIQNKVSEYISRVELIDIKLRDEADSNVELYKNFLNFVSNNPDDSYYSLAKLVEASRCNTPIEALSVAHFFSTGEKPLLTVNFCYFDFDGNDIPIDKESYIDSLLNGTPPVSEDTGLPINDFLPSRLGFYCNLSVEALKGE